MPSIDLTLSDNEDVIDLTQEDSPRRESEPSTAYAFASVVNSLPPPAPAMAAPAPAPYSDAFFRALDLPFLQARRSAEPSPKPLREPSPAAKKPKIERSNSDRQSSLIAAIGRDQSKFSSLSPRPAYPITSNSMGTMGWQAQQQRPSIHPTLPSESARSLQPLKCSSPDPSSASNKRSINDNSLFIPEPFGAVKNFGDTKVLTPTIVAKAEAHEQAHFNHGGVMNIHGVKPPTFMLNSQPESQPLRIQIPKFEEFPAPESLKIETQSVGSSSVKEEGTPGAGIQEKKASKLPTGGNATPFFCSKCGFKTPRTSRTIYDDHARNCPSNRILQSSRSSSEKELPLPLESQLMHGIKAGDQAAMLFAGTIKQRGYVAGNYISDELLKMLRQGHYPNETQDIVKAYRTLCMQRREMYWEDIEILLKNISEQLSKIDTRNSQVHAMHVLQLVDDMLVMYSKTLAISHNMVATPVSVQNNQILCATAKRVAGIALSLIPQAWNTPIEKETKPHEYAFRTQLKTVTATVCARIVHLAGCMSADIERTLMPLQAHTLKALLMCLAVRKLYSLEYVLWKRLKLDRVEELDFIDKLRNSRSQKEQDEWGRSLVLEADFSQFRCPP